MSTQDVFAELPVLRTERLTLRRLTEVDADGLFEIFADAEVTRYYAWNRFTDRQQGRDLAAATMEQYRRREALRWGLLLPERAQVVGTCGYTRWSRENRFAVLGYDLARPFWGRGLMSEAVTAVLGFGFGRMALHRVEATVLAGNAPSERLLDRAGFVREGHLAERLWHQGTFHDVHQYGLLRSHWPAPAGTAQPRPSGRSRCCPT